ncbi:MAG: amidohydrolase family protein [Hyphomicrobiales bacterium]|nr:amidohydrolase family protein [Hyphomicrobiales bacterium]
MTTIHGVTHSAVSRTLPAGACDCHTHVFGPASRYPWWEGRAYTPPDASVADLSALHRHLGIARVVIVHPSPYGTDNRITLDAIAVIGAGARGVAVISPSISDADLAALDRGGMRGARVNLQTAGVSDPAAAWAAIDATVRRIAPLGWHLQAFTSLPVIAALEQRLSQLPIPLVIDHFGGLDAAKGPAQPGFDALLRLVGSGRAYVKLSAAYRASAKPDAADLAPFAKALIAANPDRMLWGTDWPHPGGGHHSGSATREAIEPFQPIDDGAALERFTGWCETPAELTAILSANPARLYGFDRADA